MRRLFSRLQSLWWNLVHRQQVEADLDDELQSYIELLVAELERAGMTRDDAWRAAHLEASGVEQTKEFVRDSWSGAAIANTLRDVRHAVRALKRSPGFVAIAAGTLAVGIAGATAVFSIIQATLLSPLPAVTDPQQLVSIERVLATGDLWNFSYPDYVDFARQLTALSGLAGYDGTSASIRDPSGAGRAWVGWVTGNFFSVLGARPVLGRYFDPSDLAGRGVSQSVVLGYDLWQRRFAADARVLGSTVTIDRDHYTIVGVAPPSFTGAMTLHPMEMWVPIASPLFARGMLDPNPLSQRGPGVVRVVGRLAPGKTLADVRREAERISSSLARSYPEDKGRDVRVYSGAGMMVDERIAAERLPRLVAFAVGLLLLIACANVGGLVLVRASARRRELSTRLALGASRAALIRRLSIEGGVIAGLGGALGVGLAHTMVRIATIVRTIARVPAGGVPIDARVLFVSLGVTAFAAVAISLVPAWQVSGTKMEFILRDGSAGAVRRTRGQRVLVAVQVAISLLLLASSGMLFSAFRRALSVDPGFQPRGLAEGFVSVSERGYDTLRAAVFFRDLMRAANADPQFSGASLTTAVPPAPWVPLRSVFRRGEEPPATLLKAAPMKHLGFRAYVDWLAPGFFDVMRIRLTLGRDFTWADNERSPWVAIVNRRLADQMWPNQNPVGKYVVWPVRDPAQAPRPPLLVVGVVANTRHASMFGDPPPVMYLPFMQHLGFVSNLTLVVRGSDGSAPSSGAIRRMVAATDQSVPVLDPRSVGDDILGEVRPQRVATEWVGVFGFLALLLAALGIYGVVSQAVLQRARELAVRSALGATPRAVLTLVLREGAWLAAFGALSGSVASLWALRFLRSTFPGMSTTDLRALIVTAVVLGAVLVVGMFVPARRAARLNPVDALRCD